MSRFALSRASPELAIFVNIFIVGGFERVMFNPNNLKVLDRAIDLVGKISELTEKFSWNEDLELGRQMRRAAESIGSNISEGCSRGIKEYIYFLNVAIGSCNELETQLKMVLVKACGKTEDVKKVADEVVEIRKMIFGVKKFLEKK